MKSALLLLAFFGQYASRPPDVPLADSSPDFPLRVHVIASRWGGDTMHLYRSLQGEMRGGPGYYEPTGSFHGYGSANLLGDSPRGFDFSFDCPTAFVENRQPQDFYQARWKKPKQRLELLMQPVGSTKGDVCELKVAMKPHPFDVSLATAAWKSAGSGSGRLWEDPEVAFAQPDPDYPVRLHVITGYRHFYAGGIQGYGTAKLISPTPQGVDYTYDCGHSFLFNTQPDDFFQARWVKQDERLELLLQRIGSDQVDRCQIKVTLKGAAYADNPAPAVDTVSAPAPTDRTVFTRPQP